MPELLTVDEALTRIVEHALPLPVERVPVADADGRVVREPARAAVDLPPFPSSAMDGFAVRSAETPGDLPISFRIAAGAAPPGPLPAGAAAGIATGGTVPDGADAVVPVELVEDSGERVTVPAPSTASTSARAGATSARATPSSLQGRASAPRMWVRSRPPVCLT